MLAQKGAPRPLADPGAPVQASRGHVVPARRGPERLLWSGGNGGRLSGPTGGCRRSRSVDCNRSLDSVHRFDAAGGSL